MNLSPLRFDHAGYAVKNIQRSLDDFLQPLFQPQHVGPIIEDAIQKVRVCFVTLAGGVRLEFIEPTGPDSPISQLLEKGRGGIYHCCFISHQLDDHIAAFTARRCLIVSEPQPARAFNGRRIAFLFGAHTGLFELLEASG